MALLTDNYFFRLMLLFLCVHAIHLDVMQMIIVIIAVRYNYLQSIMYWYSLLQRQNVMIVEMMINVPMKKIMDNLELVLLDQCVIILQDVSFVNCIQVLEYIFVIWIHFSFRKVWWWKVYFERLYDATNQNQWLPRHQNLWCMYQNTICILHVYQLYYLNFRIQRKSAFVTKKDVIRTRNVKKSSKIKTVDQLQLQCHFLS